MQKLIKILKVYLQVYFHGLQNVIPVFCPDFPIGPVKYDCVVAS